MTTPPARRSTKRKESPHEPGSAPPPTIHPTPPEAAPVRGPHRHGEERRPRTTLPSRAPLGAALTHLDRRAPGQAPALRHALLDILHNLAAAGANALWHDLTDRPRIPGSPRLAALQRLMHCVTATAAARHSRHRPSCPGLADLARCFPRWTRAGARSGSSQPGQDHR